MYHQPSAPPGLGGLYMFQWNDDNCETKNNFICKYTSGTADTLFQYSFNMQIVEHCWPWFIFSTEKPQETLPPNSTLTSKMCSVWLSQSRIQHFGYLKVTVVNMQWNSLNVMDAFHYRWRPFIGAAAGSKWPQPEAKYRLTDLIHTTLLLSHPNANMTVTESVSLCCLCLSFSTEFGLHHHSHHPPDTAVTDSDWSLLLQAACQTVRIRN